MKKVFHIFLIFCLVFAPKLPIVYDGMGLVGVMCFFLIILNKTYFNNFKILISSNYILSCLGFILLILFFYYSNNSNT